ncbi:hypothetical protein C8J57DRAFT_1253357 [Mycena rebaudengoi]|nr:hypothetical protein C8J57DRAFT_1253357 [Mycena rebaudengoi]
MSCKSSTAPDRSLFWPLVLCCDPLFLLWPLLFSRQHLGQALLKLAIPDLFSPDLVHTSFHTAFNIILVAEYVPPVLTINEVLCISHLNSGLEELFLATNHMKMVDTSTTKRATRATPDLLKMPDLLAKTRTELYQMSNSSTQWERETHKPVYRFLVAKGFLEERDDLQVTMSKMALVLLHIVAQGGRATTADALRTAAILLEHRCINRALNGIWDSMTTLVAMAKTAAAKGEAREVMEKATGHTMLEATNVLTCTVDEQVDSMRATMELLEKTTDHTVDTIEAVDAAYDERGDMNPPPPRLPLLTKVGDTTLSSA